MECFDDCLRNLHSHVTIHQSTFSFDSLHIQFNQAWYHFRGPKRPKLLQRLISSCRSNSIFLSSYSICAILPLIVHSVHHRHDLIKQSTLINKMSDWKSISITACLPLNLSKETRKTSLLPQTSGLRDRADSRWHLFLASTPYPIKNTRDLVSVFGHDPLIGNPQKIIQFVRFFVRIITYYLNDSLVMFSLPSIKQVQ